VVLLCVTLLQTNNRRLNFIFLHLPHVSVVPSHAVSAAAVPLASKKYNDTSGGDACSETLG
jgi:hypothetical protein